MTMMHPVSGRDRMPNATDGISSQGTTRAGVSAADPTDMRGGDATSHGATTTPDDQASTALANIRAGMSLTLTLSDAEGCLDGLEDWLAKCKTELAKRREEKRKLERYKDDREKRVLRSSVTTQVVGGVITVAATIAGASFPFIAVLGPIVATIFLLKGLLPTVTWQAEKEQLQKEQIDSLDRELDEWGAEKDAVEHAMRKMDRLANKLRLSHANFQVLGEPRQTEEQKLLEEPQPHLKQLSERPNLFEEADTHIERMPKGRG